MDGNTCTMPTAHLGHCSRPGRYRYIGHDGRTVAFLCAQHERSGGHSRILRPRPWEYAERRDVVALGEAR